MVRFFKIPKGCIYLNDYKNRDLKPAGKRLIKGDFHDNPIVLSVVTIVSGLFVAFLVHIFDW